MGQNFIRTFGLTLKFVERDDGDSDEISLAIFIGRANDEQSLIDQMIFAGFTATLLLTYLGCFTVIKFRRVTRQELEFK